MIDICPYYYKDEKRVGVLIAFEYCHKPISESTCPDRRKDNECKVFRMNGELTDEGRKWIKMIK